MKSMSYTIFLVLILLVEASVCATKYDEYGVEITQSDCDFEKGEIVPRQILVGFTDKLFSLPNDVDGASIDECDIDEALKKILVNYGAKSVRKTFPGFDVDDYKGDQIVPDLDLFYAVNFDADLDVGRICEELEEIREVLFAQPNRIIPRPEYDDEHYKAPGFRGKAFPDDDPDDLDWDCQWNLENTYRGIECPRAWTISTGDSLVRVAVLEDGISHSHYDLEIVDGLSFFIDPFGQGQPASAPLDTSESRGHSTQSAGVIAARTNNTRGIAGVAGGDDDTPGCSLISLQILKDEWKEEVLAYALYIGADSTLDCDVISMSFMYYCYSEPIRAAAAFCNSQGTNLAASKGQHTDTPDSSFGTLADLDYSWITAVGSYGKDGLFCDNDEYCGLYSRFGWGIDILAPGWQYPSTTVPGEGNGVFRDYALEWYGGSSGGTPHVAASLGLLRSVLGNGYNPIDYESILKLNSRDDATDDDPQTWHKRYGHGCLEIGAALEYADDSDNEMIHFSALGSSSTAVFPDTVSYTFMKSGPYQGDYDVIVYRVSASISFGGQFSSKPIAWGEGGWPLNYTTAGFSAANPNYCRPFNGVVDTTVTTSGCTVFTYVYKVHDPDTGNFLGWYPTSTANTPIGCVAFGNTSKSSLQKSRMAYNAEVGPNPFNAELNISFELSVEGDVVLDVFNVRGLKVRELCRERLQTGEHVISWNGRDDAGRNLPSGVYFMSIEILGAREIQKVVMIK